jgi:hypothetical protein
VVKIANQGAGLLFISAKILAKLAGVPAKFFG